MLRRRARLSLIAGLVVAPDVAAAHDAGNARLEVAERADGAFDVHADLAVADVRQLLGLPDGGVLPEAPPELTAAAFPGWLRLESGGALCPLTAVQVAASGVNGVRVQARASCSATAPTLRLGWPAAQHPGFALSALGRYLPIGQEPAPLALDAGRPFADLRRATPQTTPGLDTDEGGVRPLALGVAAVTACLYLLWSGLRRRQRAVSTRRRRE